MDLQKFKAVLITATLLGIGIGLMGFGWNMVRTDGLLDQNSAATEGRVIDSSVYTGSRGGEWPSLVVEYTPTAHAPITRKFAVNQSTYQTALETRKVVVNYWPDDPRIGRVNRFETLPFQLLIGLGAMILLAGLFCLVRYLKWPSKAESPTQVGT
jgi:Protein of unknown function (DUF3592)